MKKYIIIMACIALAACAKENTLDNGQYTLTVNATKADCFTKALELSGSTLNAYWGSGDVVTVFNQTQGAALEGTLTPQTTGSSTTKLRGTLTGTIETGDILKLMFLSSSYSSQTGTLAYIAANCDYAEATVTVSGKSGGTLTTSSSANFDNKQAIIKFLLYDKANNVAISPSQLTVTDGTSTVSLTDIPTATYTDNGAGVLYVAFPAAGTAKTITLTATNGSESYTYETASAKTFTNGQYYGITVKMTEVVTNATPLTLEALTAGTITVSSPKSGMKYSKNGGAKTAVAGSITVAIGDKVRFYGNGNSITSYSGTKIAGGTAQVKAYGNMISLVKETDYTSATTLAANAFKEFFKGNTTLINASGLLLPANTTLADACCQSMFSGCSNLTTAPAELSATTLASNCYRSLFFNCTSLTTVPVLPATTMYENCYYQLFKGCTALTTVPADLLPATTMVRYCYYGMFYGCTNLTTVPALPATQINDKCYNYMFYNCSNITTAPVLPAQTVPDGTYQEMFKGCSKLNSVTCYLTEVDNDFTAASWLSGVAATGTFTTPSTTNWSTGVNGIPSGWTRVDL